MKVLVAVDGSEYSRASVALLERLPLPADAEVVLFTVLESAVPFGREVEGVAEADAEALRVCREDLHQERRRLLSSLAEGLARTSWSVSTRIAEGHAADRIIAAANDLGVDHIVLGSHGVTGFHRFLLGSVSRAVVNHATCSVLVVRKRAEAGDPAEPVEDPPRILVAFDASPSASAAIDLVRSLPLHPKAEVEIVTVLTVATTLYGRDILERVSAAWQEYSKTAARELEAAEVLLAESAARVTTKLVEGGTDAGTDLLNLADEWAADVIGLGSTGTSTVEQFLLGSVTARVVDHAACSVWVVRQRGD